MSRFYICGKSMVSGLRGILICDKHDDIVEFVNYNDLDNYVNAGIKIDGLDYHTEKAIGLSIKTDKVKSKDIHTNDVKKILSNSSNYNYNQVIASFVIKVPNGAKVGYLNCTDVVELRYSIIKSYRIRGSLPKLCLSCYCVNSKGIDVCNDVEVLYGDSDGFPLVDEFWWKLLNSSNAELSNVVLKYFGCVKNIIKLSTVFEAYYLVEGDDGYDKMLNLFTDDCLVSAELWNPK